MSREFGETSEPTSIFFPSSNVGYGKNISLNYVSQFLQVLLPASEFHPACMTFLHLRLRVRWVKILAVLQTYSSEGCSANRGGRARARGAGREQQFRVGLPLIERTPMGP